MVESITVPTFNGHQGYKAYKAYKGESFVAKGLTEDEDCPRQEYKPTAWVIPEEFQGIMTYNPRHDIQDFLDLANLQGKIPPDEFVQRQTQTINRTRRQLEKMLGERFRIRSSQVEYFVEEGILESPDYPEPVIERYEKGRRFLAQNGSTEAQRELAEVQGMRQVEKNFSERKLPDGDKVIIISPRGPEGTLYNDSYFDVYEQKEGKITMTRYHSTHDYQGFLTAAKTADPTFDRSSSEELIDAYFLKKPITTSLSTEQILETFALDIDTQSEKTNQKILEACLPYINYYLRILTENPLDIEEIKRTINTICNVADEADTTGRKIGQKNWEKAESLPYPQFATIEQAVNFYGQQPVRIVSYGCPGGQRGFSLNQPNFLRNLAFSIGASSTVDFAEISNQNAGEKTLNCTCPFCGMQVEAIISSGTISCPQCQNSAPYKC